jgi:hypothetical protein
MPKMDGGGKPSKEKSPVGLNQRGFEKLSKFK